MSTPAVRNTERDRSPEKAALQAFAAAVADDIGLLASLHDRELSWPVVEALKACPFQEQLGLVLKSEPGQASLKAFGIAVEGLPRPGDERGLDLLSAAYADVYLRHAFRVAPAESVWLTEDGLERQAPMFEVREFYLKHNLKVADWANRPDDHIVLELRFVAELFARAEGPLDLVPAAEFLDRHLMRWVKPLAIRLVEMGADEFYAALAVLTASYLDEVRDHLASITGVEKAVAELPKRSSKPPLPADGEGPYVPGLAPSW